MSIDFDLSKIEDYENLCYVEIDDKISFSIKTNGIVWLSHFIGMNEITEDNWMAFYARVSIWQKCAGAVIEDGYGNPIMITPSDIKSHIGFHSNVAPMTKNQFKSYIFDKMYDEAFSMAKREILRG